MRYQNDPTLLAPMKAALFTAPQLSRDGQNGVPMEKVVWHKTWKIVTYPGEFPPP